MRTGEGKTAGELLSEEMRTRKLSVRKLARLLAGEDATDQEMENWRSKIIRYRNHAATPREETAAAMEKALGKRQGYFPRLALEEGAGSDLAQRVTALEQEMAEMRRREEPPATEQPPSQGI